MNGLNNRQQPLPPPPAGYYPIPQPQLIPAAQQHVQIQPPPQQTHGFQPKPSLKKPPVAVHQQRMATGQKVTKRSIKKSKVS